LNAIWAHARTLCIHACFVQRLLFSFFFFFFFSPWPALPTRPTHLVHPQTTQFLTRFRRAQQESHRESRMKPRLRLASWTSMRHESRTKAWPRLASWTGVRQRERNRFRTERREKSRRDSRSRETALALYTCGEPASPFWPLLYVDASDSVGEQTPQLHRPSVSPALVSPSLSTRGTGEAGSPKKNPTRLPCAHTVSPTRPPSQPPDPPRLPPPSPG
jgi:hypothetical protein